MPGDGVTADVRQKALRGLEDKTKALQGTFNFREQDFPDISSYVNTKVRCWSVSSFSKMQHSS